MNENRPGWQTRIQISDKPAPAPERSKLAAAFARRDSNQTGDPKLFERSELSRFRTGSYARAGRAPAEAARWSNSVGQTLIFLSGHESIGDGRNGGVLNGHDRPLKRNLQHFIHGLDKIYRKAREDFLRDVRQVLLIVLRKEHGTQAHSMSGKELLFDAADGENFATKRDFAGHGDVAAHRNFREGAYDGVADGDAGGRAVFRDGAFRNVHVDIDIAVEIFRQAEGVRPRTNVAHGGLRGFLHHVSELAGECQAALAFHQCRFCGEYGAADFGPREAGGEANFVVLFQPELAEFQYAEVVVDVDRRDFRVDLRFRAFGDDFARHLARDVLNFALEAADAGFMRVVADDVQQALVGGGEIL